MHLLKFIETSMLHSRLAWQTHLPQKKNLLKMFLSKIISYFVANLQMSKPVKRRLNSSEI